MAVAEKTTSETGTAGLFDKLSIASLAGVVYVIVTMAIVFTGIPALWTAMGLTGTGFTGTTLVLLASFATFLALAYAGYRLMGGADSRPGLRAGIFMGLVWLLMLILLCRWIAGIFEGWTYSAEWFTGKERSFGIIIPAVLCGLLVWWLGKKFFKPGFEAWLVRFEAGGWFHARSYKPGQGMRVRRGTILGILVICCSGIYILVNRETLHDDWDVNIPFTGNLIVEDSGNIDAALDVLEPGRAPDSFKFRVLNVGASASLKVGETLDRDTLLKAVRPIADQKSGALTKLLGELNVRQKALKESADKETRREFHDRVDNEASMLSRWIGELRRFQPQLKGDANSLFLLQREIDKFLRITLEAERERKRVDEDARRRGSLDAEMELIASWVHENQLPEAGMVVDRFLARDIDKYLDPDEFRVIADTKPFEKLTRSRQEELGITKPGSDPKPGAIVNRTSFEQARDEVVKIAGAGETDPKLKTEREGIARDEVNKAAPEARPLDGYVSYASILILPAIAVTLPLLFLVLSVWLAWRIVNLPVFADFLIATEAEINKVSWTTRSRLIQDTIVVLVTMILMALFLFVVDVTWAKVLSWQPIGVLKVSEPKDKEKTADSLRW